MRVHINYAILRIFYLFSVNIIFVNTLLAKLNYEDALITFNH